MAAAIYVNTTDASMLALVFGVILCTVLGSLLVFLGLSFRYVRSPMNLSGDEQAARWAESKRRRKRVRRIFALIAFACFVAGFFFLHAPPRTGASVLLMAFFWTQTVMALMARSRWSYD